MDFAKVIQKIPVFNGLSQYQVQQFLRECKSRAYKKNEVLCSAGEPSNEMFILISGSLKITATNGHLLSQIDTGEIVGEMGLVTNTPRCATITALEPVNVLVIRRRGFTDLLNLDADMGMKIYNNLLKILVVRLRENNEYVSKVQKKGKGEDVDLAKEFAASTV